MSDSVDLKVEATLGESDADSLLDTLNDLGFGSVLAVGNESYSANFTVEASHVLGAFEEAQHRLENAAGDAGCSAPRSWPVPS